MQTLEVRRAELGDTRVAEEEDPPAGDGQAVLGIERFGLTTNNVTYGVIGDVTRHWSFRYWDFFPAAGDGWGRVPAWGIATVQSSRSDAATPGDRLFGFLPMGTHLVIEPGSGPMGGIVDASAHRAAMPAVYNFYGPAPADRQDETVALRPLFLTALVLDAAMARHGAEQVVVSSASARTASAYAFLAAQRELRVVGLSSAHHREWVEGLGVYSEVLAYDDLDALDRRPSVYVDVAGSFPVRAGVHRRLADDLVHSAALGTTHGDPDVFDAPEGLPGPRPQLFFAPEHLPDRDPESAWADYCAWTDGWLTFSRHAGIEAAADVWREALSGKPSPSTANLVETG